MHPELKRRLEEAQIKVLANWFSEQIWMEFEMARVYGCYPARMEKDVWDHTAMLARYRCRKLL